MKELKILGLLLFFFFCNLNASAIRADKDLQISIIVPPVIRRNVLFPLVAVVTNKHPRDRMALKQAEWLWQTNDEDGLERDIQNLQIELQSSKTVKRNLEQIDNQMTAGRWVDTKIEEYKEQIEQGRCYLRLPVTSERLERIKEKKALKLTLRITGSNMTTQQEISEVVEKNISFDTRPLGVPQVPPGINYGSWCFGDTHSHSTDTWDYGFANGIYTIPELKTLAQVAGLDWLTLTDHAYCLNASKHNEQKTILTLLCDDNFAFLYGEELSCNELVNGSLSYDTCHYNGIMNEAFISCRTDLFRKASSPDSQQGIDYIKQANGLVIINHPDLGTGLFEAWNFNINTYPYTHGETGMEILNGSWDKANHGSVTRWIDRRLLNGEKVFPFAGSDTESHNHFGECYTVVYADCLTQQNIKENLKLGHHYVTTYPGLAVWARPVGSAFWSWMGETISAGEGLVELYISTNNANQAMYFYVMKGKKGWLNEEQVYSGIVAKGSNFVKINLAAEADSYLRVFCHEVNNERQRAYTTPIWIK